jgi:hypothetical protein
MIDLYSRTNMGQSIRMRESNDNSGKINFHLDIHNFGPIEIGKISLNPLTILIGPNNSGKSYAAMLLFSFFESYLSGTYFYPRGLFMSRKRFVGLEKKYPELLVEATNLLKQKEINVPEKFTKLLLDCLLRELYEGFGDELVRSFASPAKDLVSIDKRKFSITVRYQFHEAELEYHRKKVRIVKFMNTRATSGVDISRTKSGGLEISIASKSSRVMGSRMEQNPRYFVEILLDFFADWLFRELARPIYYLPAARSGILQGHRALAATIVKRAGYAGIERFDIPLLSGMVSGFISSVIAIEARRGPLYDLGSQLEKEITKGEIILRSISETVVPEIRYKIHGSEIPLHRASSTVSEIAPLILYIKYNLRPRSILIIEEPEAHLHPENQRIMAKYLVRLIRRGIHVVITTHSPLLIEQLNTFMKLSNVEPDVREKEYLYGKDDFLNYDEVAAFLFRQERNSILNKIVPIQVTIDGISQDEFIKINENLYEETYRVEKNLSLD